MRYIATLLLMCCMLSASALRLKINCKDEIRPIKYKIERAEIKDGETTISIKLLQRKNFSYNVAFDDCYIIVGHSGEPVQGKLTSWKEDRKPPIHPQYISDEDEVELKLTFPGTELSTASDFTLKIGTIQDRNKTELLVTDIKIKKK